MKLVDAFDLAATTRPTWKTTKGNWNHPVKVNRGHLLRILGPNKNVKKITKGDLAALRTKLVMEKKANGTINRVMATLNTVFKELVDHEVIDKFPRLKKLEEKNARKEYFSQEDIDKMIHACHEIFLYHELADAMILALYTGSRQAHLLTLEVRDIDLDRDTILFRDPKCGEDYTLDIHPKLKEILEVRCEGEEPNTKLFLFKNKDELYYQFKKVRNYCGIDKKLVWHSYRHTCGTWLADRGVPIQSIAKVLNHKTLEMSLRYAKITDKARKTAINSL